MQMPKIYFIFIILLMIAQPIVFANNDINKEETKKNATEFLNFLMSNFNNLQNQITDLKEANAILTQKNLEFEAKIEELSKQLVSNYTILHEQHSANKSELDANKFELDKVKKDIVSSNQEVKENYVSKAELENIKEKVQQQLDELKNNISTIVRILRTFSKEIYDM